MPLKCEKIYIRIQLTIKEHIYHNDKEVQVHCIPEIDANSVCLSPEALLYSYYPVDLPKHLHNKTNFLLFKHLYKKYQQSNGQ